MKKVNSFENVLVCPPLVSNSKPLSYCQNVEPYSTQCSGLYLRAYLILSQLLVLEIGTFTRPCLHFLYHAGEN